MFRPLTAAAAFSLLLLIPEAAMARRGGAIYGEREIMLPVSPTDQTDGRGNALSLCVLQHQYHFFFLSAWAEQKYVLAPNNCDDDGYYDISQVELSLAKARGEVPKDVPDTPKWTLMTAGNAFALWIAVAALVIGAVLVKIVTRQPVSRHEKLFGPLPDDVIKMADVMVHAARQDGRVRKEQVALIKEMLEDFTRGAVDKRAVAKLIKGADTTLTDKALADIAEGSSHETRMAFLSGAMDVLRAGGKVSQSALKFVVRLGKGLGLNDDEIERAYQQFGQAT
ncbi:tellurite resistance TerB family protein [Halovulum sp. GXIMD14793]